MLRFHDLYKEMGKDQSEACKSIQKLNSANMELELKCDRLEQRLNFVVNEFKNKTNEANFWK